MPTLFERLDTALTGVNIDTALATQSGNLGAVATLVANLIEHPPSNLGDLSGAINELPLPNLAINPSFVTQFGQLRAAVPTDLSAVTGVLTAGLSELAGTVGADLAEPLGKLLAAIAALRQLTTLRFTCPDTSPSVAPFFGLPMPSHEGALHAAATTPSPLAEVTRHINSVVTLLESAPTDVALLLAWLSDMSQVLSKENGVTITVPLLHEVIDPLQTVQSWQAMQPAQIRDQMGQTLQTLTTLIQSTVPATATALNTDVTALVGQLPAVALTQVAADLTSALAQLKNAINSGNLAGTGSTVAAFNTVLDDYTALRTTLQPLLTQLPPLGERCVSFVDEAAAQLCHLEAVLAPDTLLNVTAFAPDPLRLPTPPLQDAIQAQLQPVIDWLQALADLLDISALTAPLQTVAQTIENVIQGLEQNVASVTAEIRALFSAVETLLAAIDLQALVQGVQQAINNFATTLTQQLSQLFQPVREALAQIVTSISDGIDAFDPAALVAALQQAIQAVTSVFTDPAVVSAINHVRTALESISNVLVELSFAPLTDEVVAAIEEITSAIQAIDTSALGGALQGALSAALSVLPPSLTPITDPLIDEFGELIEAGPVPLLESIADKPNQLLDSVRRFDPATLIGDELSAPFTALIAQMEQFQPSRLLEPVTGELQKLKTRLAERANPGAALAPLEQPFAGVLQAFDQLQPDALLAPLNNAIQGVVDQVRDVLPVDELFDQLDSLLTLLQDANALGQSVVALIQKLGSLLQIFQNSEAALTSWLATILDKIEAINDTSSLQPRFAALNAALEQTKSTALTNALQSAVGPAVTALQSFAPQAKLAGLVQALSSFPRTALAALPASPEKEAITAALARFTPLDAAFSAPYRLPADFLQQLRQAQTALAPQLTGWDERYHGAASPLTALRKNGATAAELRQWVADALEPQLMRPLRLLFAVLEPLGAPLASYAAVLETLANILQDKLTQLLAGPTALAQIRDNLQGLLDRLGAIALDFLRESIAAVFGDVRSKIEAINPANLRQTVETAFTQMLNAITLEQVLPSTAIATLDADYAELITKLKALDPKQLVTDIVKPEFENKILPLLDAFDLTVLFQVIIERLHNLDDELKQELTRVNTAYQGLRGAAQNVSGGVSVGV
ncbi:MAG: hypothetical protein DYG89_20185 [Caldilinea sp. CFX5]|nr:hypothetical protein [Caldilinea sp. CFX5]